MKKIMAFVCILQTGKMIAANIYSSSTFGLRDTTTYRSGSTSSQLPPQVHSYGSSSTWKKPEENQLPITSSGAPFQSPPNSERRPSQSFIRQNEPVGGFRQQPTSGFRPPSMGYHNGPKPMGSFRQQPTGYRPMGYHRIVSGSEKIKFQTISPKPDIVSSANTTSTMLIATSKDRRE